MAPHPQVPWIHYAALPDGRLRVECQACHTGAVTDPRGADAFVRRHADHRASPTHYGAGDAVRAVTGALGVKSCAPCEQRRVAMNGWLPRLWRR